jgi:ABC-type dipeptide/oligopeptide/nickel transport system permease subunit
MTDAVTTVVSIKPTALLRQLLRHKLAAIGLVIIVVLALLTALAPVLAPYDPHAQDLYNVLSGPSPAHWLGTDNVGRDLLSRFLYGGQVSLLVGVCTIMVAAVIGIVLGLVAGYLGGATDAAVMRITDAFMCIPPLIFVLILAAALGPGIHNVAVAIVLFGWTGFTRIVRGQVLLVRELPFIEAARAAGASPIRIMLKHILPNTLAPLLVTVSLSIGGAILLEASVSFLGIGVQPPTASWGKELRTGLNYLELAPLYSIVPGLLITLAVIACNFIGDGLRDALDPRLRGDNR